MAVPGANFAGKRVGSKGLNPPGRWTNCLIIVSMHRNLDIYLIIVV